MSRDKDYRTLVSSTRWRRLAVETKTAACWQCSMCGIVTTRLAVHHIKPVESGSTFAEMEALCFDPRNLEVLCYQCHKEMHRRFGSASKEAHIKAERARVERHKMMMDSTDWSNIETI